MQNIDHDFINRVEKEYFRTDEDTGAAPMVLMLWNLVRQHVGLEPLDKADLPAHCATHQTYHRIRPEYGCERTPH